MLNNLTQGGQVFLHNFRMIKQVTNAALAFSLTISVLVMGSYMYMKVPEHCASSVLKGLESKYLLLWTKDAKISPNNAYPSHKIGAKDYLEHPYVKRMERLFTIYSMQSLNLGIILFLISYVLICLLWMLFGKNKVATKTISGLTLVTPKEINKLIKNKSEYKFSDVTALKDFEIRHTLFCGTTGVGKSTGIKELLTQIRTKVQPCVIVDTTGELLDKFYRSGDIVLNSLDSEARTWDLFKDTDGESALESVAADLIPLPASGESFWAESARALFTETLKKVKSREKPSISEILNYSMRIPLNEAKAFYKGTDVASFMTPESDRTASSIRAHLAIKLKHFESLTGGDFSINEFVKTMDNNSPWVFITCKQSQRESMKALMSVQLATFIRAVMDSPIKEHRRTWFVLDELASMQKISILPTALSELRKFGGCIVTGFQSLPQLKHIYGLNTTQHMISLFNTKVFFRMPESDTALALSRLFGETVTEESNTNISYGAHEMRDGVSLNTVQRTKPLIPASDFLTLPDLNAFIKFPGDLPATKVVYKF